MGMTIELNTEHVEGLPLLPVRATEQAIDGGQ